MWETITISTVSFIAGCIVGYRGYYSYMNYMWMHYPEQLKWLTARHIQRVEEQRKRKGLQEREQE